MHVTYLCTGDPLRRTWPKHKVRYCDHLGAFPVHLGGVMARSPLELTQRSIQIMLAMGLPLIMLLSLHHYMCTIIILSIEFQT